VSTSLLPAWRNAEQAIVTEKRWAYGDLIPWADLHDLFGLEQPSADERADVYQEWQLRRLQQVDALRKHMLKEHAMYLETEIGEGLRIVLPAEQTARVQQRGRASLAKALREMADGLTHINRSQLTAEQIRENTDAQVRLAARVAALRPIDRGERLDLLGNEKTG
jgi:hypothetical protein